MKFHLSKDALFEHLFHHAAVGICIIDPYGQILNVNQRLANLLGYAPDELINLSLNEITFVEQCADVLCLPQTNIENHGEYYTVERQYIKKNQTTVWLEINFHLVSEDEHEVIVGYVHDITARKIQENKLKLDAIIFEHTRDAMIVTTPDFKICHVNRGICAMTGYSKEQFIGQNPSFLRATETQQTYQNEIDQTLKNQGTWQGELEFKRNDGEHFPAWACYNAVFDDNGNLQYYIAILTDISELKNQQKALEYAAHHDLLTGLPNRLMFYEQLEQAVNQAKRHAHKVAVMFIDLDKFKQINDSLGHQCGDAALVEFARRLNTTVRREDVPARLGGDEFVVMLPQIDGVGAVTELANRIKHALTIPLELAAGDVRLEASIGICIFPDDAANADELVNNADKAMYKIKHNIGSSIGIYTR